MILLYLMSLAVGMGTSVQAGINGALGRIIGVAEASLTSVSLTWLCILLLIVGGFRSGNADKITGVPPYLLLGGVFGAAYLLVAARVVPAIGVGAFIATVITGQLLASVLLDQVGAFGVTSHPLDWSRVLGVLLLLAGMKLIVRF
jgi:bacterial/archaeal transporter family-2 protein